MPPIDLTKREVAEVLAEFEESLPNQGVKLFRPNPDFNPRDITLFGMARPLVFDI